MLKNIFKLPSQKLIVRFNSLCLALILMVGLFLVNPSKAQATSASSTVMVRSPFTDVVSSVLLADAVVVEPAAETPETPEAKAAAKLEAKKAKAAAKLEAKKLKEAKEAEAEAAKLEAKKAKEAAKLEAKEAKEVETEESETVKEKEATEVTTDSAVESTSESETVSP